MYLNQNFVFTAKEVVTLNFTALQMSIGSLEFLTNFRRKCASSTSCNLKKIFAIFKIAAFAIILLNASPSHSQRKILTDEETVQFEVIKEIDAMFQSENFLKKKDKKFKEVKGTMIVDIGVVQNGKVSSFFKIDNEIKNIDFINFMSDYILDHKFNFKLPKEQHFKIRYSITF